MTSRILIVEDDPAQRRILEELVKRFGFESIAADGGIKGLEVLNGANGGSIELVILDLMMPGMDGLEFIEKMQGIRGDQAASPGPVGQLSLPAVARHRRRQAVNCWMNRRGWARPRWRE